MADVRTSFITLEDVATGAGVPLHKAVEGDAAAGKNAHGALVAKDDSGNLQYVRVNSNREIVVSSDSADLACLTDEGGVVGTTSFQDIATIALNDGAVYKKIGFSGSSFRDAIFELLWVDDVGGTDTETILHTFRVGAGAYNEVAELSCLEFTAGTTAELRLRGKNLNVASDIDGMISVLEVQ
jgi:hypothetical protein